MLFRVSIPQEMKDIYKTVWEIKMRNVIDLAADRGAFVDQSQVNLSRCTAVSIIRMSTWYYNNVAAVVIVIPEQEPGGSYSPLEG